MQKKRRSWLAVAWLLPLFVVLLAGLPAPGKEPPGTVPRIAFEKYTLPNGLQVILHVDPKLPIVNVNQWFHVGSKDEKPGRTGFAHLFEHLMFQGSKNAPGEYFARAEKAGANLQTGGVNGTTNQDRTNYFITVPSGNLEYALWLESDRLATLADALTKDKLDNQREVVRNERRQGLENRPYGRWHKLLMENLYPAGHPYSWPVIGSHEDLMAASLDDVKAFFRRFYTPNNLSLVIAGDFNPAEAKRLVHKYFGDIPAGPALERPRRWVPRLEGEKVVEVRDRVPQERVYLAWPSPPYFEAGEAELDLAASILADGLSSRLQKVLVYDRQLCSDVSAFNMASEIAGAFVVIATARPGQSLPAIEESITAEIARLAREAPTSQELQRTLSKVEYGFITGLERIGGFGGKADILNQYNVFLGDPGKFEEDLLRYRHATASGVREAVARWLDTRNRLVIRFRPEVSGREAVAALDRSRPPSLGEDRPFRAPEVRSTRLDNGLEVLVVERPELPKVAVILATRGGSVADPTGKEGLAALTVAAIDKGTRTRKALDIEGALGDLGTSLTGFAQREYAVLSLEVLKRNLAPAMAILADVAIHPVFPQAEVDREKKLHLDALAQQDKDANALVGRIGSMLAFGYAHPYGRPNQGFPATVQGLTRDDLVRSHQTRWQPGGSALVLVGDITLSDAVTLAQQNLGHWSGGPLPEISIPAPRPVGPGKVFLVDRQDAAQTIVAQILPGPVRRSQEYYALNLADAVWGGSFSSRLNLNLREDKGYSYGVFSFLKLYSSAGSWWAMGGIQTDKTSEALVEFARELQALSSQKPISVGELTDAKANLIRGYAQQFETLRRIAGEVTELWVQGLPMSELQRAAEELQGATPAQVNAAARKYARPELSTLLLVGDRSKIEPGVRALKLGEIVVVDEQGRPVSGR